MTLTESSRESPLSAEDVEGKCTKSLLECSCGAEAGPHSKQADAHACIHALTHGRIHIQRSARGGKRGRDDVVRKTEREVCQTDRRILIHRHTSHCYTMLDARFMHSMHASPVLGHILVKHHFLFFTFSCCYTKYTNPGALLLLRPIVDF